VSSRQLLQSIEKCVSQMLSSWNVLNHVRDRSSHLTGERRKNFKNYRSVRVGYYTTLRYDVIHDILVLFSLHLLNATVEVIWFDISSQAIVLHFFTFWIFLSRTKAWDLVSVENRVTVCHTFAAKWSWRSVVRDVIASSQHVLCCTIAEQVKWTESAGCCK